MRPGEIAVSWPAGRRPTRADRRRFRRELRALARVCKCTCVRKEHEHFRAGTDCRRCGKGACPAFRPARRKIIFRRIR